MGFHGDLTDAELEANLLIQQTRHDQPHYFSLAMAQ
jgi:hypothetical protein